MSLGDFGCDFGSVGKLYIKMSRVISLHWYMPISVTDALSTILRLLREELEEASWLI